MPTSQETYPFVSPLLSLCRLARSGPGDSDRAGLGLSVFVRFSSLLPKCYEYDLRVCAPRLPIVTGAASWECIHVRGLLSVV